MQMIQRIAIIAAQRSGTHALGSVLTNNGFVNFDEIFLPTWSSIEPEASGRFLSFLETTGDRAVDYIRSPGRLLEGYIKHLDELARGSYIIDIKYNMLQHFSGPYYHIADRPEIVSLLSERGFKFIHLFRANSFKRYFSAELGHATGQFHIPVGTPEAEIRLKTLTIDVDRCLREVRAHQQMINLTNQWLLGVPDVLTLQYEGLFSGDSIADEGARLLNQDLGIVLERRNTSLRKPARKMRDVIVNYDEVALALRENGFGYMVTE